MAQDTWALKLDTELKEKLQGIIKEDFESSKDFMEQVISLYELDKLKRSENILTTEVAELEILTRRINEVFINANGKIHTMLKEKDTQLEKQMTYKDQLIESLQADKTRLEQEKEQISSINDSLVNSIESYKQEVNQFTKSNQTLEDLVAEYKEKNDTLTGTLTEYKEDRERNKLLEAQNRDLESKVKELTLTSSTQAQQLLDNERLIQDLKDRHEKRVLEIESKCNEKIETAQNKAEMNTNMRILELQQEYQSKIQALQEKHNLEIEQYQTKYRELLEKIEKKKVVKSTNKTQSIQKKSDQ